MSQESDVCCTTSIYDIQNRCIPDEIDLVYFKICIITHNNNVIEQNINVSMFDILFVKEPHIYSRAAFIRGRCLFKIQLFLSNNSMETDHFNFKKTETCFSARLKVIFILFLISQFAYKYFCKT